MFFFKIATKSQNLGGFLVFSLVLVWIALLVGSLSWGWFVFWFSLVLLVCVSLVLYWVCVLLLVWLVFPAVGVRWYKRKEQTFAVCSLSVCVSCLNNRHTL